MKHFKHLCMLFAAMLLSINVWGADVTGTITFGTNNVKIDKASATGDDDLGNSWTITTVGTSSFTANNAYYQVGASKSPATSITFTTTLPASQKITSMSAKFGGFSGTAGTVTLKIGETSVATGALNAANDVTVKTADAFAGANGTVLTVTVTGIAKGVKVYNISYTYSSSSSENPTEYSITISDDIANGTVTADKETAAAGTEITLTATPSSTGYEFGSWNVTNASTSAAITVTDNKFQMPAANVNVSATFNAKAVRPENEIFYESFNTNDGTGGNDDQWSGGIAANDIKQDNDGWVYEKGSGANKCAKFGTGSVLGSATTPAIGQACNATLSFKAAAWNGNSESTTLKLSVVGGGSISPATVTLTKGAWNTFTATLTNLTADSKIKFEGNAASNSRFFLDEVSIVKTGEPTPVASFTVAPASIDFGSVDKDATVAAQDVTVTLTNTDHATATLSGTNAAAFEIVAGAELTATGVVSVRPTTAALAVAGTYAASLDVEADGVTDAKSVALSLTVTAPAVKHNVIWSVNGVTSNEEVAEGAAITFADPEAALIPTDVVFKGWAAAAIVGTQAAAPEYVTEATMGTEDVTYFAVFATEDVEETTETFGWEEATTPSSWKIGGTITRTEGNTTNPANSGSYYGALNSNSSVQYKNKVKVKSFSYYCVRKTNNTNTSIKIETSTNGSTWTEALSTTWGTFNSDGKTYKKIEKTWDEPVECYVRVNLVTAAGRMLDDISISYVGDATYSDYCTSVVVKTLTGIEVTGTPAALWKGDEFSHEGVTVTAKYLDADDEDVTEAATFSGYDMATAGAQTVTVAYKGQETSYDITVKTIANDAEHAYTVAEAKALVDAGKDLGSVVFVAGKVSKLYSSSVSAKGQISFYISEDGASGEDDFEMYQCLNIGGAAFTDLNQVKVGADVVAKGTLTKYNTTYELATNCELVSYEAPADSKNNPTLSISGYKTSVSADDDDFSFPATYDGDGVLTVSSNAEGVATVSIEGTTITVHPVAEGTAKITVTAPETENYYSAEKFFNLTVTPGMDAAELSFSFDGGRDAIATTTGMRQQGLGGDYGSSPKLKVDDQGDFVIIKYNAAAKKVTYKLKGNGMGGTYAFDVQESEDGKNFTTVHSHTAIDEVTTYSDNLNGASRYVKFVYTTKASGNVALGAIKIVAASAVEPAGLAFENASYRFLTTTENKAVVAVSKAGSTGAITYSCEDANLTINAETGVITCTTAGTYTVNAAIAATADYEAGNVSCTVKIVEPAVANSIIVAETTEGKVFAMTNTAGDKYITHVEIAKMGGKYVVASEIYNSILYTTNTVDGKTTIVSQNNQYLQATGEKNVSFTDNEYLWTNTDGKLIAANVSHGTLRYNTGSPRFTTYISATGQIAKIVSLDEVIIGEEWTRTFTSSNMGTHCYPFTIPAGAYTGATFYVPAYRLGTAKLYWDEVTGDIEAGKPYLIVPEEGATKLVAIKQAETAPEPVEVDYGMVGVYAQTDISNSGYYIVYNNEFRSAGNYVAVGANRAYIDLNDITNNVVAEVPGRRRISMNNADVQVATGMESIIELNVEKVLINGAIYILRGEKMYNLNGQLVK